MRIKSQSRFLCSLLFIVIVIGHVHAATPDIFVVTEHSPPYQFLDEKKTVAGLSTELIKATLQQTPYQYQINIYPWSRAFVMATEKPNTCIYLMSRNEDRENRFQWIDKLVPTNDYFIGLSNRSDLNVNSIEDIKQHTVAVLKEDRTYYKLLKLGFVENKNLYVINNTNSMLNVLLKRKNIDYILADTINVKYRANFNNIDHRMFKTYFKLNKDPVDLYLACGLDTSKEIVDSLRAAVKTIKSDGTYDKILDKWQ